MLPSRDRFMSVLVLGGGSGVRGGLSWVRGGSHNKDNKDNNDEDDMHMTPEGRCSQPRAAQKSWPESLSLPEWSKGYCSHVD